MAAITAKIFCASKGPSSDGLTNLSFVPDYADGRNKEWSKYTPSLSLNITVLDEVAENFEQHGAYTLTFEKSED